MRARQIERGDTRSATRRVRDRKFRLAPSREVNEAIGYFVAVLSERYGVKLTALDFLSNHYHDVNVDENANLPAYHRDLHHFLTKQLNAMFDDCGPMWDSEQTNHVKPVTADDTLGRIAYTMANPVHHALVKFAKNWPGLRMCWPCRPRTFKRPKGFLDEDARRPDGSLVWPEKATLTMHRPKGFDHLSDNELAIVIKDAIHAAEEKARAEVIASDGTFVGRRNIRRMSRHASPTTEATRSDITPRFACRDEALLREAVEKERAFLEEHADSMTAWRAGDRSVVFPVGTYKMRVVHNVRVASGPD